jgi:hypothetical protein
MLSRTKTLDVAVNIGAVAARLTDTILVMSTTNQWKHCRKSLRGFARREISEETSVLLLGDKRKYAMWLISRALSYSDSGISGCQRLVCHVKPQLIYPICCWTDRRKHILPAFQETRRQDEGLFRPSVRKTEFHFIRRRHRKGDARAQPVEDRSTLHQWKFAALD